MTVEGRILKALSHLLEGYRERGELLDKTPREIRTAVAAETCVSIEELDEFKSLIKKRIHEFTAKRDHHTRAKENKPKNKPSVKRKHKKRRTSENTRSSHEDISELEGEQSHPMSPGGWRSMAKMLGVPPSFWQGMDKDDVDQIKSRILDFSISKNIRRADPNALPTIAEATQYMKDRELQSQLEGINSTNIISGKRIYCFRNIQRTACYNNETGILLY